MHPILASLGRIAVALVVIVTVLVVIPSGGRFIGSNDRARVSRVRSDMRTMHTALATYRAETGVTPPFVWVSDGDDVRQPILPRGLLTTPVAYLSTDDFLADPHSKAAGRRLSYLAGASQAVIVGVGLDGRSDTDWKAVRFGDDPEALRQILAPTTYDPTNGTVSPGDIYRIIDWLPTTPASS